MVFSEIIFILWIFLLKKKRKENDSKNGGLSPANFIVFLINILFQFKVIFEISVKVIMILIKHL